MGAVRDCANDWLQLLYIAEASLFANLLEAMLATS